MDLVTFLIVILTFISWGVGSFIAKLASDKIGVRSVFWDIIGNAPVIIIYGLIAFKLKNLLQADKLGIGLSLLSGVIGSVGAVGFYLLLSRSEASAVVPLTALYPALTVILAIIFLHESLNATKLLGIILSLIAIYLLSK